MTTLIWFMLMACSGDGAGVKDGKLVALDEAPVNCTVTLQAGSESTVYRASHKLCRDGDNDRRSLIGKDVSVTLAMVNIQKESCAGKTNCMDLEEVLVARTVEAR